MAETHFHTILVIGEEPEKTIAKYSSVTEVEKHLKIKRDDAPKLLNRHIKACLLYTSNMLMNLII